MWFNLAASQGNAKAAELRNLLAQRMTSTQIFKANSCSSLGLHLTNFAIVLLSNLSGSQGTDPLLGRLHQSHRRVSKQSQANLEGFGQSGCEPAWNIDPLAGVIGVQY